MHRFLYQYFKKNRVKHNESNYQTIPRIFIINNPAQQTHTHKIKIYRNSRSAVKYCDGASPACSLFQSRSSWSWMKQSLRFPSWRQLCFAAIQSILDCCLLCIWPHDDEGRQPFLNRLNWLLHTLFYI